MKPKHILPAVLALVLLAVPAFAGDRGGVSEDYKSSYSLSSDGWVELENINGNVKVEGWDRDEVEVNYVKHSRSQEGLDRVEVRIDETAGGLSISTEYKGNGRHNEGGSVEFTLSVPRGAELRLDLVNGSLDIRDHAGRVTAELVNGNLDAELAGEAELSTVNGGIDVNFTELRSNGRYEIESVNGSLTVGLPSNASARIEAETVHGSMSNDFGVEVEKGRYVGKSMRGTIGGGDGPEIELSNVNGSIKIVSN